MDHMRDSIGFGESERRNLEALLPMALAEDLDQVGDITTTATIPSKARGAAALVARSPGVLAGLPVAERLAAEFELLPEWRAFQADGDRLEAGTIVARLADRWPIVLFIDDDETKVSKLHVFGQKCLRADHHLQFSTA